MTETSPDLNLNEFRHVTTVGMDGQPLILVLPRLPEGTTSRHAVSDEMVLTGQFPPDISTVVEHEADIDPGVTFTNIKGMKVIEHPTDEFGV